MPRRSSRKGKQGPEPESRGLSAAEVAAGPAPSRIAALEEAVIRDGGSALRVYKDPLGGRWQLFAALPIGLVRPTPYQRDLSEAHVERLSSRIGQLERFLDPIIAYRVGERQYWTPNGNHRLAAMRRLGARTVLALLLPDEDIAFKILALNTEKAHNVREKSIEVVRMARALAELDPRPEKEFLVEFEDPTLLTLGICYEKRARFAGGAYQPVLRRLDTFLDVPLPEALRIREERAARLLALDDAVTAVAAELKRRGFESPYLKAFVVARINPLRFKRGAKAGFDETLKKMRAAAERFDPAKVKAEQLARTAGSAGD